MVRLSFSTAFLLAVLSASSLAQTFNDLPSYCRAMTEASTSTLLARTQGIQRSEAEALTRGMTDPVSIRMVKELIDFSYSRPASAKFDALRAELLNLCLAKKIFVQ
jgi:hypothetical protein